jgi:hypothetical protein
MATKMLPIKGRHAYRLTGEQYRLELSDVRQKVTIISPVVICYFLVVTSVDRIGHEVRFEFEISTPRKRVTKRTRTEAMEKSSRAQTREKHVITADYSREELGKVSRKAAIDSHGTFDQ